jgi:hypothetical protein
MTDKLPKIPDDELQERVIYSLLRPAVRLARLFKVPLKDIVTWVELAYFHELKDAGFTQRDSASLFDVSTRKVAQLAARLKQNFFKPEHDEELPRRIEFMLWAGPESEGRIHQSLTGHSKEEVRHALELLVDQERAVRVDGRTVYYEVPRSEFRLYQDHWMAKIDGLNNHLFNVVDGVFARFFANDHDQDGDRALARSLNFRIRKTDIAELRKLYEEVIFPRLRDLDEAAKASPEDANSTEDGKHDSVEMGLSINWAPHRYTEQLGENDNETNE